MASTIPQRMHRAQAARKLVNLRQAARKYAHAVDTTHELRLGENDPVQLASVELTRAALEYASTELQLVAAEGLTG